MSKSTYTQTMTDSVRVNLPPKAMTTVRKLAMISNKPVATTITHFIERSLSEMLEAIEILERAKNLPKIDTSAMLESAQRKHTRKINKASKKKPKKIALTKTKKAVKPLKTNLLNEDLAIHLSLIHISEPTRPY